MYNILIVGCGYVGTRIGQHFAEKKQRVFGLLRSESRKDELESLGIHPVIADITKPETLANVPPAHFVVICPAPDERTEEAYRFIYIEGVRNYLEAIPGDKPPYLITYLSSTGVYGDHQGSWVNEETLLQPVTETGKILVQAERQVLATRYPSTILRLAGIYGPGRNRIEAIQKGTARLPDEDAYMNFIHVDDIVGMMKTFFEKANVGDVYLGCDDTPMKRSDYYGWLCGELGRTPPQFKEGHVMGKRCSNQKIKSLGYIFEYPNVKTGYEPLLKSVAKPEI